MSMVRPFEHRRREQGVEHRRATRFFRADLLDAQNAKYASSTIDDYVAEGSAEDRWSGYNGKQGRTLRSWLMPL